jgi:hypothetical protein
METLKDCQSNIQRLSEERTKLYNEIYAFQKQRKSLYDQINEKYKTIKEINKDIQKNQDRVIEIKLFKNDIIRSIPGLELVSLDSLRIIEKSIDAYDYIQMGVPKYIYFEKIIKTIINIKLKYPTWKLNKLTKGAMYNTIQPEVLYEYEFKTGDGMMFTYFEIIVI